MRRGIDGEVYEADREIIGAVLVRGAVYVYHGNCTSK